MFDLATAGHHRYFLDGNLTGYTNFVSTDNMTVTCSAL